MKKVVVITGPTAVGKTSLSIELAKTFHAEIINADASQFRKRLNIGTAKITPEEMGGIVHHLIDIIDVEDSFSIKNYQEMGRKKLDEVDVPFVVGGSGLYLQALLNDYKLDASSRSEERFKDFSNEELYAQLLALDEEAALKLHPNNRRRVERYLELVMELGKVEPKPPLPLYDVLTICLVRDRDDLYERINQRTHKMMEAGWVEEAIRLRSEGIDLSTIKDIGYKEIGEYLDQKLTLEETIEVIQMKTRHYAKRQMTWFRNKMDCIYYDMNQGSIEELNQTIKTFFNN